jgi:hypothetical protein
MSEHKVKDRETMPHEVLARDWALVCGSAAWYAVDESTGNPVGPPLSGLMHYARAFRYIENVAMTPDGAMQPNRLVIPIGFWRARTPEGVGVSLRVVERIAFADFSSEELQWWAVMIRNVETELRVKSIGLVTGLRS